MRPYENGSHFGRELRWLIAGGCLLADRRVERTVLSRDPLLHPRRVGLGGVDQAAAFPVALFVRCLIAAAITLPLFLFYTIAFSVNPAFAAWSAQNNLASPVADTISAGLSAARRCWQRSASAPHLAARSGICRSALIIGWVLIVPILVYLPINVQRRMSEAVIVPLAILAAAGLRALAEHRVHFIARGGLIVVSLLTSLLSAARRISGSVEARPPAVSPRRRSRRLQLAQCPLAARRDRPERRRNRQRAPGVDAPADVYGTRAGNDQLAVQDRTAGILLLGWHDHQPSASHSSPTRAR